MSKICTEPDYRCQAYGTLAIGTFIAASRALPQHLYAGERVTGECGGDRSVPALRGCGVVAGGGGWASGPLDCTGRCTRARGL